MTLHALFSPSKPRPDTIDLGLGRVSRLVSLVSALASLPPTVHIAGTNGKGSVSSYIDSILRSAGFRTGRFNSPHLVDVWDSIRIDGEPVTQVQYNASRAEIERVDAEHELGSSLFEILTVTAFYIFAVASPPLDIIILEVGLGGRLDATNVLAPENTLGTVITSVSLDHQAFLGNTVEEVASEKAGIIKSGVGCVVAPQESESVVNRIREIGIQAGASHIELVQKATLVVEEEILSDTDRLVPLWGKSGHPLVEITLPFERTTLKARLPLAGDYQLSNVSVAVALIDQLRHLSTSHPTATTDARITLIHRLANIDSCKIGAGIERTSWAGRLEWVSFPIPGSVSSRPLRLLVDGAHNASAAIALRAYIDNLSPAPRRVIFVLAFSAGKDLHALLSLMLRPGDALACTGFGKVEDMPWVQPAPVGEIGKAAVQAAGLDPEEVEHFEGAEGLGNALGWAAGLQDCGSGATAEPRGNEDLIVLAGSLYVVAELYRLRRGEVV
uniref:Mur ligase central domain-containing protein n=1 Tax=Bartheletia paradoxa TaxID=669517 RepID=A0A2D0XHY2_9BASI|nr:hypothetical protein SPAR04610 [Bartheletia paradoxa]